MSPVTIMTEPEKTNEFKQGYREGYEAGKACLKRELKALIKNMPDNELYTTTSSTYINIV